MPVYTDNPYSSTRRGLIAPAETSYAARSSFVFRFNFLVSITTRGGFAESGGRSICGDKGVAVKN